MSIKRYHIRTCKLNDHNQIKYLVFAVVFFVVLTVWARAQTQYPSNNALIIKIGSKTEYSFSKWNGAIDAFERVDSTNPPLKGTIEFIGSSTIARWKTLADDFPGQPVFNRGFGGCQIVDCTHFAPRILIPYEPKLIFFRAGGNDLVAGKAPEQVFADFKEFAETIHACLPKSSIIFISWSPTPSHWTQHEKERKLNMLVADYAYDSTFLRYIEAYDVPLGTNGLPRQELFMSDGVHFNADGYKLLAQRVRDIVGTNLTTGYTLRSFLRGNTRRFPAD